METDRHAPDGDDRIGESAPTPSEGPISPAGATPSEGRSPEGSPAPHAAGPSYDYGYGEAPLAAAGADGPRAADSGTGAAEPAPPGSADAHAPATGLSPATGSPSTEDPATGDPATAGDPTDPDASPATGLHSATGVRGTTALRGATAPRAVLRPVPEGFPTPPPRPARPNRRPAPKLEEAGSPKRRSGLLIAGVSLAAVLLLVVVVGGGILAIRSFSSAGSSDPAPSAQESEAPEGAGAPGDLQLAEVTFTEVSTEVGVRSVGVSQNAVEPEGEFIIVTFEVDNRSDVGVSMLENLTLETTDGTQPVDVEATGLHQADSSGATIVQSGATTNVHAVFDVPIGAEPEGLHITLNTLDEAGTLPLGT
ncbi:hypothetical protein [Brachybacterium sp.]|uniref:hypothetical protein n=1 Tax=Brachybacterium sp. TaxID=1891286 RepID=UPI002ED07DE7